jgi:hypothetical protein
MTFAKEVRRSDAGTLAAYVGGAARDGTYSHLHPSRRIDPNDWRIFVRANSHVSFAERVGSWPPQKREVSDRSGCGAWVRPPNISLHLLNAVTMPVLVVWGATRLGDPQ